MLQYPISTLRINIRKLEENLDKKKEETTKFFYSSIGKILNAVRGLANGLEKTYQRLVCSGQGFPNIPVELSSDFSLILWHLLVHLEENTVKAIAFYDVIKFIQKNTKKDEIVKGFFLGLDESKPTTEWLSDVKENIYRYLRFGIVELQEYNMPNMLQDIVSCATSFRDFPEETPPNFDMMFPSM